MTVSPSAFIRGAGSLLAGLGVTIKAMFQPVVTSQYPRELLKISPRFRGHTKLVADRETAGCGWNGARVGGVSGPWASRLHSASVLEDRLRSGNARG